MSENAVTDPVARVYGQAMAQLPLDLYIPPDALEVMLEAFEGPLDLLLYLIRNANINVLDIPMAPLTEQYLTYVEAMRSRNLELAADYLVMAAMLIEIKSRMLLPPVRNAEGEEAEDPRAELVRRLIEYEQMKQAARRLDELPQAERDFEWVDVWVEKSLQKRFPDVFPDELQAAWQAVVRQARLHTRHTIVREELSVREHMGLILRRLRDEGGFVEFARMFDAKQGAPVVVVHFLAMLELAREHLLEMTQSEIFAPIYVRLTDGRVKRGSESRTEDGSGNRRESGDEHEYGGPELSTGAGGGSSSSESGQGGGPGYSLSRLAGGIGSAGRESGEEHRNGPDSPAAEHGPAASP
jgi:segregation and condensation protein A